MPHSIWPLLLIFQFPLAIFAAQIPDSPAPQKNRALISGQTLNFQFSDPLERVICTKGPRADARYSEAMCKKGIFDQLEKLNFFIVGDIGGSSVYLPVNPYTTHAQRSVAAAMAQLAKTDQPQFVVNLGDNFYLNGVKNINDERFQKTFEDVYEEKTLGVPWFPIPGNHDYHGNVQAQIDYTNRSTRWTFPGANADQPYYKIRYEFGASKFPRPISVEFLMIDTVMLCGMTEDVRGDSYLHWIFHESNQNPTGPIPGKEDPAQKQWDWIFEQLKAPNADYLFVGGHYPIYSVGKHGSFYNCLKQLDTKMREAGVSAYLSGHDHNLQHLVLTDEAGRTMNYVVSGAGAATDRSQEHWEEFKKNKGAKVLLHYPAEHWWWKADEFFSWSTGGFIQAQATADYLNLSFYSGQGTICAENVPVVGGFLSSLFGGKKGPGSVNCKTLVHQTTICPRQNAKKCLDAQLKAPEQGKAGWLFNGKNWWCLYLC